MSKKRTRKDPLVQAVEELAQKKETEKMKRTLLLKNEPFERFQEVCRAKGVTVASVIDKWIERYLELEDRR